MLNQYTLIGRVAKDPQLMTTRDGVSYARFTLAVRKSFRNQSGNYDTDFIPIISWSKLAERVSDYCGKGSLISVNGRIHMRGIELDNNQRMAVPDIVADTVTFLQLKRSDQGSSGQNDVPVPGPPPKQVNESAPRSAEPHQTSSPAPAPVSTQNPGNTAQTVQNPQPQEPVRSSETAMSSIRDGEQ